MPTLEFSKVPRLTDWQKASSVALALRSSDIILTRIDNLVAQVDKCFDRATFDILLCDLFFTMDYWLKTYKNKPHMEKGRAPAIQALYEFTARQLSTAFGCTINVLPRELELAFGRTLSDHGATFDKEWEVANYLSRAEARKYRIRFKHGKAYQFNWWDDWRKTDQALVLAESSRTHDDKIFSSENYTGFVMSMSRDLYIARHSNTGGIGMQQNFYHSSYLAGEAVMCAGTILIQKGVIRAIRLDSGHYQPTQSNLIGMLQALQMFGVRLNQVRVEDFKGNTIQTGLKVDGLSFLAANGKWNTLVEQRKANIAYRKDQIKEKSMDEWLYDEWIAGTKWTNTYTDKNDFATKVANLNGFDRVDVLRWLTGAIRRAEEKGKARVNQAQVMKNDPTRRFAMIT